MKCRQCQYLLDGLVAHSCPECGRPFHPDNPDSYLSDEDDTRQGRLIFWSACLGLGLPLPATLWLDLSYLVGRLVLGRWPRVHGDDPREILVVNLMHAIADFLLLLSPVAVIGGIVALVYVSGSSPRSGLIALAIILASWIIAAALCHWINVWEWNLNTRAW